MSNDDVALIDIFLSIGVGLSLGWFVGGLWNKLQGRAWSGKKRK